MASHFTATYPQSGYAIDEIRDELRGVFGRRSNLVPSAHSTRHKRLLLDEAGHMRLDLFNATLDVAYRLYTPKGLGQQVVIWICTPLVRRFGLKIVPTDPIAVIKPLRDELLDTEEAIHDALSAVHRCVADGVINSAEHRVMDPKVANAARHLCALCNAPAAVSAMGSAK